MQSMQLPTRAGSEPIPGYRLIERLGRGGYGEVWKAEAPGGMHKAIKFVFGDMDGVGDEGKAAEQEFRSLNRVKTIRHPFLLSLERIEVIDGQLMIVMELADRNLLDRWNECSDQGLPGVPRRELLVYMEESAEALDLMNLQYQIQHLDIKPQNLFLVHRHVKVADFGLAKDLEGAKADLTGGITPMYAPPETFEGWVSRQSDQYSLAIVYMEMLTGKRPFNGSNTRQLILQHMTAVPDLAPLPPTDREAVAKALSKKPEDRFATCTDFVRALSDVARRDTPMPSPVSVAVNPPSVAGARPSTVSNRITERGLPPKTKAMPALVTPKSKTGVISSSSTSRRLATEQIQTALPLAPNEVVGSGVLVPTLLVGLGGTGLTFLRSFRAKLRERFGRPTLPHLRWLFIDSDPATTDAAVAGTDPTVLDRDEVILAMVRRPAHYLSKDGMVPVDTWMKQEDLFRIPKTPATEGVRCIGRLALCDHYPTIVHRIRRSIEPLLNPNVLNESQRLTGLEMWTNVPRVVVAAGLEGGTGSGMFLDLTYIIRRELRNLGCPKSRLIGMLGVPSWITQANRNRSGANTRAALEELNHFHNSAVDYSATFDTHEGPIVDRNRPFHRVTLVPLPGSYDPVEMERSGSLASQILQAELFSPIGRALLPETVGELEKPFALVGLQSLVWPRSAVLRSASSMLLQRTLSAWTSKSTQFLSANPGDLIEAQWEERQLGAGSLKTAMSDHLRTKLGESLNQAITTALRPLLEHDGNENETQRVRRAFQNLVKLIGRPDQDENEHPFVTGAALKPKIKELGTSADSRLANAILTLVEQPGLRLAGAEEAVRTLRERIGRELNVLDKESAALDDTASRIFSSIHQQLIVGRQDSGRTVNWVYSVAEAMAPLQGWAMARAKWQINQACSSVYRTILGTLPEVVHEISLIRSQLTEFGKTVEETAANGMGDDPFSRTVFPDGSASVWESAKKLVEKLMPNELRDFEHGLQSKVRHICRGVTAVCARPKEHGPAFLSVLDEQATRFLEVRIPGGMKGSSPDPERVEELIDRAAPTALGQGKPTVTFIGMREQNPALLRFVQEICPGDVRNTAATDELFIWREFQSDKVQSFRKLCCDPPANSASVYTRRDVDWIPLEAGENG